MLVYSSPVGWNSFQQDAFAKIPMNKPGEER